MPTRATHAHLFADGRVMFWYTLNNAFIWDLGRGTFAAAATAGYNMLCPGHALLRDGRLLVVGGHFAHPLGMPYANVYDPAANAWPRLPDMNRSRWYPTATV